MPGFMENVADVSTFQFYSRSSISAAAPSTVHTYGITFNSIVDLHTLKVRITTVAPGSFQFYSRSSEEIGPSPVLTSAQVLSIL